MRKLFVFALALYSSSLIAQAFQEETKYLRYVGFDIGQSSSGYSASNEYIVIPENTYVCEKKEGGPNVAPECIKIHWKSNHKSQYVNLYTGFRIGDNSAFEIGSFSNNSFNSSRNKREGQTTITGGHMGFVFCLPFSKKFELLSGIGVAHAVVKINKPGFLELKENGFIPRLIIGPQYRLTDKLKVRASVVYYRMTGIYNDNVNFNNIVNLGLGLNYSFDSN